MNSNAITVTCPECQQIIQLTTDLVVGQITKCPSCDTELVITWLFPVCVDTVEEKRPISPPAEASSTSPDE